MTNLFWRCFGMITRRIDILILWPSCKQGALDMGADDPLDTARGAFALHCFADPGWRVLPLEEITRRIGELT